MIFSLASPFVCAHLDTVFSFLNLDLVPHSPHRALPSKYSRRAMRHQDGVSWYPDEDYISKFRGRDLPMPHLVLSGIAHFEIIFFVFIPHGRSLCSDH